MHDTLTKTRVDVRLRQAIESGTLPKELLVCGPAGTGKTWAILTFLHLLASDYSGLRILICRKTRRSLTESVLVTYEQEVLPADSMEWMSGGVKRDHRTSYSYPSGSEILIGGLDRPDKILSTSWDVVYINEVVECDGAAWDTLSTRLNRPGRPSWLGYLMADTNPGDPSHWLKLRCDDGRTALWDTRHEANPVLHDGKDWTAAGRDYLGRLDHLRGSRRKRLLEGLWAAGEAAWFDFGQDHVTEAAEYEPTLPVHLAVDSGVFTGAVAFQLRTSADGLPLVSVFYDYLSEGATAEANARAILSGLAGRRGTRLRITTDPAGGARNPIGPTVLAEYQRCGLPCEPWPGGSVADGLALIEALLGDTDGRPRLVVHPRCKATVNALTNYKRARRAGQLQDRPEDPQHPHEDLVDALRGGLRAEFPRGLAPAAKLKTKPFSRVFY